MLRYTAFISVPAFKGTNRQLSLDQLSGSRGVRRHVAELEAKVLELLLERKAAETRHVRELTARDSELARLQLYIEEELTELQERQAQVEEAAPAIKQQLQEARAALHDLSLSEQQYQHLKEVPFEHLPLPEAVRVAVYESLQELLQEVEQLRGARESEHEAALGQEAELNRLQRDNAKLAAIVAENEADIAATISSLESRNVRLASELEEAVVQLELSRGKGAAYDSLAAKAERLEVEVSRLVGIEAAADRLRTQLSAADAAVAEKDSAMTLLLSDKAYLTKEVEVAEERLSELTCRLGQAEDKVSQLKAERHELYQKLAIAAEASRTRDESRWEREVAHLQAAAAADLEMIRKEAAEGAEREGRMLRDLRDAALDESSRTKSELRQLRQQHEDLLLSSREAASRADVAHSELLGELRVKQFELTRLQALSEERGEAVHKLSLQVELLTEKVQLLNSEINQQEQEHQHSAQDLQQQLDKAQALLREYQAADGALDVAIGSAAAAAGSQTLFETLFWQQMYTTEFLPRPTAQCSRLESEKQRLVGEMQDMSDKLARAQAAGVLVAVKMAQTQAAVSSQLASATWPQMAVEKLHKQLQLVGQPHSYLLQQLQATEAAAAKMEQQLSEAQAELRFKDQQAHDAAAERAALRRDLEKILQERGTLESMRRLVAAAITSAATAAGHQARGGSQ
eukprot:gene2521-2822_t